MKNILNRLIQHEILTKDEAKEVLVNIWEESMTNRRSAFFKMSSSIWESAIGSQKLEVISLPLG